ncbi:BTB/POZ and MATH domain-containing protein 2 [Rhynchospora pubera]|uniref:BTB/POZ and MATH domain-containing protein 2 n=1 Tax=Rhynchospora pubera TaxID=906938 RepID=A0AAV8FA54_9POAL|nr:BTB/POZ and MATH domain-containing protein 2 [Rhynchospora pubera]KAJ4788490.1 BTB/POZ and MATH domain-containing protein 2 [Rhynchospora pubera]
MATPSLESQPLSAIKSLTHQIEIKFNYSEAKGLLMGQYITSPTFSVEGHDWALLFYPYGDLSKEKKGTHVSLFLKFLSEMKEVQAKFSFNIHDKRGKYLTVGNPLVRTFTSHPSNSDWGFSEFYSTYDLHDHFWAIDMLVISVHISILRVREIDDCSGGLCDHIKTFWRRGERFDVTFQVEGERISAHRFLLAARSPVFEAELYGSMIEAKSSCIMIKEMKAEVFKALLHFIYTDNSEGHELKDLSVELVQDLFVAADRYALEMLKVQCQQRLWVTLCLDTALSTLIFAERHSSPWLKEKCLEFASKSENFTELALTEEYVQMMQSFPSLLAELRQKVKNSSDSVNNVAKKQKTG